MFHLYKKQIEKATLKYFNSNELLGNSLYDIIVLLINKYISVKCTTNLHSLNFVVMKLFKKHSILVIVDVVAFSAVHNFPFVYVILNA